MKNDEIASSEFSESSESSECFSVSQEFHKETWALATDHPDIWH